MIAKIPLGPAGRPYSQGLRVEGGSHLIFISGQLARADPERAHHPGDLGRQAREIFGNIDTLLRESGASLSDVVKITAFVTTLDGYAEYSDIRREVFSDPLPASSTVQVSSLVTPGCLIEIEAIAII
ncbi:MAG: RidA family protein [Pigmentiphaga sp.]|uniref:RidA family protein n=1 Tax=Pigmentiphaga sp. TaxID=1977564 RepID=UPI0029B1D2DF|nr:RidA family protein [Pigmentiphaga sp.]MDX3907307.1 RidA family protein [Pigmentiphaga sp.]